MGKYRTIAFSVSADRCVTTEKIPDVSLIFMKKSNFKIFPDLEFFSLNSFPQICGQPGNFVNRVPTDSDGSK